jgi:hypothetical protein
LERRVVVESTPNAVTAGYVKAVCEWAERFRAEDQGGLKDPSFRRHRLHRRKRLP